MFSSLGTWNWLISAFSDGAELHAPVVFPVLARARSAIGRVAVVSILRLLQMQILMFAIFAGGPCRCGGASRAANQGASRGNLFLTSAVGDSLVGRVFTPGKPYHRGSGTVRIDYTILARRRIPTRPRQPGPDRAGRRRSLTLQLEFDCGARAQMTCR